MLQGNGIAKANTTLSGIVTKGRLDSIDEAFGKLWSRATGIRTNARGHERRLVRLLEQHELDSALTGQIFPFRFREGTR